jgi:hypothetical protein
LREEAALAKFRKKPVVVEAQQFLGFYHTPWPEGVKVDQEAGPRCYVVTAHGQNAYLDKGDWVITEPDGVHHYPCKPDIFAATYEPA